MDKSAANNLVEEKWMIGVILDLSVKDGQLEPFIEMMKKILPETRAYAGCQEFNVWVDQDTAGHVVLNEIWDSRETHMAYLGWRAETGVLDTLVSYLNTPPEPQYFEILES